MEKQLALIFLFTSVSLFLKAQNLDSITRTARYSNGRSAETIVRERIADSIRKHNRNSPNWKPTETRSQFDSIFISKPSITTRIYGDRNLEIYYRTGFSKNGDTIYLESKNGDQLEMAITDEYDATTQLDYNFWGKSYVDKIKNKYGLGFWNDVKKQIVRIGWNKEQCRLSWGYPNNVNKTITTNGTEEQWVYYSSYLYFINNRLTAIQN